ncbi:MAG TPA: hypothetical protein VH134_12330 [Candidatus Dormibacteraeota bacterium]|nr:hypothetical protein [Candidatus Dormibacteraeota bacterium]
MSRVRRRLIAGGLVAGALAIVAPAAISGHAAPVPAGTHDPGPPLPSLPSLPGLGGSPSSPSSSPGGGGPGGGGGGGGGGGYSTR